MIHQSFPILTLPLILAGNLRDSSEAEVGSMIKKQRIELLNEGALHQDALQGAFHGSLQGLQQGSRQGSLHNLQQGAFQQDAFHQESFQQEQALQRAEMRQQQMQKHQEDEIIQALQYTRAMNSIQGGGAPFMSGAGANGGPLGNPALVAQRFRARAFLGADAGSLNGMSGLPGSSQPFLQGLNPSFYSNPGGIESLAMYGNPQAAAMAAAQNKKGMPGENHHHLLSGGNEGNASRGQTACLYLPSCDDETLSDYQILLRKQIEFFEAQREDVETVMPGRKKGIVLKQVGIRCRHCGPIPLHSRTPGAAYFPAKMSGLYQAAQNLAKSHLCGCCDTIPEGVKRQLVALQKRSRAGHGGKHYWADGAKALGVDETERSLRFMEK